MKVFKWLAIVVGGLLALLIVAAVAIPLLFGDQIRALADEQIAAYVDAEVAYGDIDLSLIREFPRLSVAIDEITVDGRGAFDGVRLADVGELLVAVDFWSAIGDGPVAIERVRLVRPDLHVVVLPDGRTNTDIVLSEAAPEEEVTTESGTTALRLDEYAIEDGTLVYDDRAGDLYAEVRGLNHSGSGDFTATVFDLDTETRIGEVTVTTGGITYLKRAEVDYDAELSVDTEAGQVGFRQNDLRVNALHTSFDGTVGLPAENGDIAVDLTLNTPEQDFGALWSVVPAAFAKTLDGVETAGRFSLGGHLRGTYEAETGGLPGFDLALDVSDGRVQYPDLPRDLSAINVEATARSGGGQLGDLLVDVPRFSFRLGANPFSGSLRVLNGTTDPAFDLVAEGTLDLADLAQAVPLEGVERLAGIIDLDVRTEGTASDATGGDLRAIEATGRATVRDIDYLAAGLPAITVERGDAAFDGNRVTITGLRGRAGASDFAVEGVLTDPFSLATETGTLGGEFRLRSDRFDANEWLVETEAPADGTAVGGGGEALPSARPFDRFDIDFDAEVGTLLYDVYTLTDARATGSVTADELTLRSLSFETAGSDIAMEGTLRNLYGYTFDGGELTGDLSLSGRKLDLLALANVGVDPNAPATAADAADAEYIELPERMSINVRTAVEQVTYDDIILNNVRGDVVMANQTAAVQGATARLLGGQLRMDGDYVYRGPDTEPKFDLKYALEDIGFREAFEQFNTVQRLAPVAQYMTGKFSTDMVMSSTLGRDMMPNLQRLDADGFLRTLNASLQSFGPLQKVADLLGAPELRELRIEDTKNWFTIEDGTVTVQPFAAKLGPVDATIAGTHGLDAAMDYNIDAVIPRALLANNAAGAAANRGLDLLNGQASKLGLNIGVGENVRVRINLTGSMTDPKVGVKLLGTEAGDGSVKDAATLALREAAERAKDSLQRVAQAKLDIARADAEAKARAVADDARAKAEAEAQRLADEAKAKASAEAKRLADEAAARAGDEAKRRAEEVAKQQGGDAVEKGKEALKGLFGKKKPD